MHGLIEYRLLMLQTVLAQIFCLFPLCYMLKYLIIGCYVLVLCLKALRSSSWVLIFNNLHHVTYLSCFFCRMSLVLNPMRPLSCLQFVLCSTSRMSCVLYCLSYSRWKAQNKSQRFVPLTFSSRPALYWLSTGNCASGVITSGNTGNSTIKCQYGKRRK